MILKDPKIEKLEEKLKSFAGSGDALDKIRVLNELAWELRHADINRAYQTIRQIQELLAHHPDSKEQIRCNAAGGKKTLSVPAITDNR